MANAGVLSELRRVREVAKVGTPKRVTVVFDGSPFVLSKECALGHKESVDVDTSPTLRKDLPDRPIRPYRR